MKAHLEALPKEVKEAVEGLLKPPNAPIDVTGQLKATVGELRQLSHRKQALQKKVDTAKEHYKTLLDELKLVQEAIDREHKQLGNQSEAYAKQLKEEALPGSPASDHVLDPDTTEHVMKAMLQAGILFTTDQQKELERNLAWPSAERRLRRNTTRNLGVPGKRGQLLTVKGFCWKQCLGESMKVDTWEHSNDLKCLSLWRAGHPHNTWGERVGEQRFAQWNMYEWDEDCDSEHCWTQGLQPYVHVKSYYDSPFPQAHDMPNFDIATGVDPAFSSALEPGRTMSVSRAYGVEEWAEQFQTEQEEGSQKERNNLLGSDNDRDKVQIDTYDPKRTEVSSFAPHARTTREHDADDAEGTLGAPPLWRGNPDCCQRDSRVPSGASAAYSQGT